MTYNMFKLVHSELIMSMQYIEQDLKIIYSLLKKGEYNENLKSISEDPLGKVLVKFKQMEKELGYQKIKDKEYILLDEIREIRNYWCHQCFIDFHYIEDQEKHEAVFQEIAKRLQCDELRVWNLQQRIESFRKATVKKKRHSS